MKETRMRKIIAAFAAIVLMACVLPVCVSAQVIPLIPEMPKAPTKQITAEELFNIPADATAEQLEARVKEIVAFQPEGIDSQEAYTAFVAKLMAALKQVAGQMLKRDEATQEQKDMAYELKLQIIAMEAGDDLDKTLADIEVYKKELAEAKSDVLYQAQVVTFQVKLQKTVIEMMTAGMLGNAEDQPQAEPKDNIGEIKKVIVEIKEFLNANEIREAYLELPVMLMRFSEAIDADGKEGLLKFVITELRPSLEKSELENAKMIASHMGGLLRFGELPGSEIELQCILLDGKKLDIKDFRGKVVLIDFWATWCGPCQMAIPMMKTLYEKYHEKGLELIAYSCDEDLDALKEYEEKSPHPWNVASVLLSVEKELKDYSTHYGIPGYPTFVLVDKEGKVVHVTHNIMEIAGKLGELFPEVEIKAEAK